MCFHLHNKFKYNYWSVRFSKVWYSYVSGSDGDGRGRMRGAALSSMETNLTMEVAQLLLSLVHAWGLDPDLDRVCEGKLGLLRPMLPVSFGLLSKGGTWANNLISVVVWNLFSTNFHNIITILECHEDECYDTSILIMEIANLFHN